MQGWPKMHFEVWQQDMFGRNDLGLLHCSYAHSFSPISGLRFHPHPNGSRELRSRLCDMETRRIILRTCAKLAYFTRSCSEDEGAFVGGSVQLKSPDLVYSATDRYRLRTEAAGTVHVHLGIMMRHFDKYGVDM